jgi:hypothetical protein
MSFLNDYFRFGTLLKYMLDSETFSSDIDIRARRLLHSLYDLQPQPPVLLPEDVDIKEFIARDQSVLASLREKGFAYLDTSTYDSYKVKLLKDSSDPTLISTDLSKQCIRLGTNASWLNVGTVATGVTPKDFCAAATRVDDIFGTWMQKTAPTDGVRIHDTILCEMDIGIVKPSSKKYISSIVFFQS